MGVLVSMRPRLALLLGVLALAGPAVLLGLALREKPAPHEWVKSPPEPPAAKAAPPAHWDQPARESLAVLRRITANEARRSLASLAVCESHAGHITAKRRNRDYRKCATAPLARTHAFASANSHLLSTLAGSTNPARTCRGRVLALSGMANTLAFTTNSTLRGGFGAPWEELLDASRSIRGLAAETLRMAREPGWAATCKPRPPAKAPEAAVL
jgi:hypothetical protein